jgi:acetolactate synthase regulatory subunit
LVSLPAQAFSGILLLELLLDSDDDVDVLLLLLEELLEVKVVDVEPS